MHEVGRREHVEAIAAPALVAVGGGIDVETSRLLGEEHLGVGMEVGQYRVSTGVGRHLIRGLSVETRNLTDEGDGALREVLGTLWTDGGAWRQQELRVEGGEVGAWLYRNLDGGSGDRGQGLTDGGMRHADDGGLQTRGGIGLQQGVGLSLRQGYHRAVTGREGAAGLGVLHPRKCLEVGAGAELIVTRRVAVVHQYPLVLINQLEESTALNGYGGLLQVATNLAPLTAVGLSLGGCQTASC